MSKLLKSSTLHKNYTRTYSNTNLPSVVKKEEERGVFAFSRKQSLIKETLEVYWKKGDVSNDRKTEKSSFHTYTEALNLSRHYPQEVHVRMQMNQLNQA